MVTFTDTWPPETPVPHLLPADARHGGEPSRFRIHTGPKPNRGSATIRAGLADRPGVQDARFGGVMNSAVCAPLQDGDAGLFPETARTIRFDVPLDALKRAYNVAELSLKGGPEQRIAWADILMDPCA